MVERREDVDADIREAIPVEMAAYAVDDLLRREVHDHANIECCGCGARDDEGNSARFGTQESAAQPGDVEGWTIKRIDQRIDSVQPSLHVPDIGRTAKREHVAPIIPACAGGDFLKKLPLPAAQGLAVLPHLLQLGNLTTLAVAVHKARQGSSQAEGRGRDERAHRGVNSMCRSAAPGATAGCHLDHDHAFQAESDGYRARGTLRHGWNEAGGDVLEAMGI